MKFLSLSSFLRAARGGSGSNFLARSPVLSSLYVRTPTQNSLKNDIKNVRTFSRNICLPSGTLLTSPTVSRTSCRLLSSADTDSPPMSDAEQKLASKLKQRFPKATFIRVNDISGGCGSMYEIQVEAEEFRGVRTILQHRLVNEALKDEIKDMHGLRISTVAPDS